MDFAKRGAHVILACRDRKRADDAARSIVLESKNRNVEVEMLDLGSLKSIEDFSKRIKAKCTKLDILVNNAGNFCFVFEHGVMKVNNKFVEKIALFIL